MSPCPLAGHSNLVPRDASVWQVLDCTKTRPGTQIVTEIVTQIVTNWDCDWDSHWDRTVEWKWRFSRSLKAQESILTLVVSFKSMRWKNFLPLHSDCWCSLAGWRLFDHFCQILSTSYQTFQSFPNKYTWTNKYTSTNLGNGAFTYFFELNFVFVAFIDYIMKNSI